MIIRDAVHTDFPAITAIYNDVLLHTTAIYQDQPVTCDNRITWWQARLKRGFPVLVAAEEQGSVLGFASFGDFRFGSGYRFTVEGTVHIHASARHGGVGSQLLIALLDRAHQAGKHIMIAGVDASNTASLRFLERHGFTRAALLPEVGWKFDRFLDLVILHRRVGPT